MAAKLTAFGLYPQDVQYLIEMSIDNPPDSVADYSVNDPLHQKRAIASTRSDSNLYSPAHWESLADRLVSISAAQTSFARPLIEAVPSLPTSLPTLRPTQRFAATGAIPPTHQPEEGQSPDPPKHSVSPNGTPPALPPPT